MNYVTPGLKVFARTFGVMSVLGLVSSIMKIFSLHNIMFTKKTKILFYNIFQLKNEHHVPKANRINLL